MFQSPRTGKFESNTVFPVSVFKGGRVRFNPLEQGNSNQIYFSIEGVLLQDKRFNPLEQGNSNQIAGSCNSGYSFGCTVSIP